MKTPIYSLAFVLIFLAACSGSASKTEKTAVSETRTAIPVTTASAEKEVATANLISSYLKLKNAFTSDNDQDAAAAGHEMVTAFTNFNPQSLTPEQAKAYADIGDDAREHAEHIGANTGNIAHQREHFDMLSKDLYDLVKMLGTHQHLYVDHCPMYNHNKGAIWLSEMKDIRNPYLGKAMPNCGTVQEELQ